VNDAVYHSQQYNLRQNTYSSVAQITAIDNPFEATDKIHRHWTLPVIIMNQH